MSNPNTKNSDELEAIAALAGLAGSPSPTTESKVPHQSTSSKASGSSVKSTTPNADEKKEDPPQPTFGEENASLPISRGALTFLNIEKVLFGEIEISFPMRLMSVLDSEDFIDILKWAPDGKAFCINQHEEFESTVLPTCFDLTKFSSFLRKLYRWGFSKSKFHSTRENKAFANPNFSRGDPKTCIDITTCTYTSEGGASRKYQELTHGHHADMLQHKMFMEKHYAGPFPKAQYASVRPSAPLAVRRPYVEHPSSGPSRLDMMQHMVDMPVSYEEQHPSFRMHQHRNMPMSAQEMLPSSSNMHPMPPSVPMSVSSFHSSMSASMPSSMHRTQRNVDVPPYMSSIQNSRRRHEQIMSAAYNTMAMERTKQDLDKQRRKNAQLSLELMRLRQQQNRKY